MLDKLVILPELIKGADWCKQIQRAEKIMHQYYADVIDFQQKSIYDVIDMILTSEYRQIFLDSMRQLKIEKLYKSDIHGQDHIERVCILTAYLGIQMKLSEHMFALCLEAAKYHDIGRCDDSEDRQHGYRGSRNILKCCEGFSELDCEMIAVVVEAHSLLDEEAGEVFDKYELLNSSDFEMYQKILYILKDADALDRFRLTDYSLDVEFLRLPESMHVVLAACEMNQISPIWKAAIVSYTQETFNVIQWVRKSKPDIEINFIMEKAYTLWNKKMEENVEIISMEHGVELYKCNRIHKMIIPCIRKGIVLSSMYFPLRNKGVLEQDLIYASYGLVYGKKTFENIIENDQMLCEFRKRKELDRLEIHINAHCNLSCANCSMFAGLVDGEVNADFDKTKKALLRLKMIYFHICEIDLIGGEPLLNPQLGDYCVLLRQLFPDAYIFIVSNGILVPQIGRELIGILQNCDIYLSVTYYPGYSELIRKIRVFCEENEIILELLQKRVNFVKLYDLSGNGSKDEIFHQCKRKFTIIAMWENELAVCYAPFAFPYAEKKFNIGYRKDGVIDLFEEGLTNEIIMKRFSEPMDCCRYCHNDFVVWQQSSEEMLDFLETWSY